MKKAFKKKREKWFAWVIEHVRPYAKLEDESNFTNELWNNGSVNINRIKEEIHENMEFGIKFKWRF